MDIIHSPAPITISAQRFVLLPNTAIIRFRINPGAIIARKNSDIITPDVAALMPSSSTRYEVLNVTTSEQ